MKAKNSMKMGRGMSHNASSPGPVRPKIGGMETLGKKPISGHFSNATDGKKGEHEKGGGTNGVGFPGHEGHRHKAIGFGKKGA
jgi:hypothetical protein